ncbi:hypothetical protein NBRC3280_2248 [Acetobacter pasteurianus NBRC 3280]|uniref:Uncharacterized protein n=1 Tax=Acetobacter pasteurianus NBRC 3278 TaxID=1226660 RepID=A0A401X682_ACEPA|nr:hypothetical protein NBRC3277_2307 [Acetobacter pasteurianus NBRC 3277]GCD63243.1 hypothetical protein NBRC3278_2336 [Acetobacter pasteurianus NBRC 3278]GCD69613.1 hypothetical protein NBRC3280_2248 [Acetobacter pasteurianus NBRC 3280]
MENLFSVNPTKINLFKDFMCVMHIYKKHFLTLYCSVFLEHQFAGNAFLYLSPRK